jgi:hypothetical protein
VPGSVFINNERELEITTSAGGGRTRRATAVTSAARSSASSAGLGHVRVLREFRYTSAVPARQARDRIGEGTIHEADPERWFVRDGMQAARRPLVAREAFEAAKGRFMARSTRRNAQSALSGCSGPEQAAAMSDGNSPNAS